MCWTHTRKHASSWLLFGCLAFPCVFAQVNVRQWHKNWCFLERNLFPYYAILRFLRLILVLERQHRWRRLQLARACRWQRLQVAETAGGIGCRWLISRYRMLHDACTTTVSCRCSDDMCWQCFIDSLSLIITLICGKRLRKPVVSDCITIGWMNAYSRKPSWVCSYASTWRCCWTKQASQLTRQKLGLAD